MKSYLILVAFLSLTACGTSAEPSYFSLAPQDGTPLPDIQTTVKVQRPLMPDYLDRPDFIYQESDYHLSIDETSNWAEPLDKMFARILAADLQQRLPQSTIWSGNDDIAAPHFIVGLTIEQFNPVARREIALKGQLIITDRKTGVPLQSTPFQLDASTYGSPRAVAAGLSHLMAQEADIIAQDICMLTLQSEQANQATQD
jgi:uncharacterized lipoprotein YmbA